ncbi:MAG: cytoplasmic protein [Rhodospirillaceae bacterium]|nr:cytoplasmic protein [Rhodospirillaceae bacterium]|tara:strand:- start:6828 stop:7436 length:609 start_codon:yes stop_codon:yes gene_type:complete
MTQPLMPKATAVWLIDNTSLTFDQIGTFCGLHTLEIQGIADGEVALGIVGRDPIAQGELTQEEINRCENDKEQKLGINKTDIFLGRKDNEQRYTPLSKRQNRPDAIAWLIKYHPELSDAQVCRLVGTTKPTVSSVRDRTHWNMANLKLMDPVTLGMCSQTNLDTEIKKAVKKLKNKQIRDEKAAKLAKETSQNVLNNDPEKI